MTKRNVLWVVGLSSISALACAADYPTPKEADWIARDFRFHTGEVAHELRLHYTTIGAPSGEPVLILHGTAGSGASMLNPGFAGELFGPGQPLDASRYFIILPDAIGTGKSAKPSDGLRAKFPHYNYDDMVLAQYRLVTEGLGLKHLRLVLGNSMGGMHTWVWGEKYPSMMDVLVPMASQPSEMSGRNWMMRRLLIDAVRNDPAWNNGNYTTQPPMVRYANTVFNVATIGGTQAYYKAAPTRAKADQLVDERLAAPFTADANDYMYQWDASSDYNPTAALGQIQATVLAINSADDERNPPELGIMERELPRIKSAKLYLIPASEETRGHGTTGLARFWKAQMPGLLQTAPVVSTSASGSAAWMEQITHEIGDASCDSDAQCHSLPIGQKACGGPESYRAWSSKVSDAQRLASLAAKHRETRAQENTRAGISSDCRAIVDPGAVCRPRPGDGKRACELGRSGSGGSI